MNEVGWDVIVVLVILLVGGFFSGAEMALVSLREGQVRSLAQRGRRGQRAAKLAEDHGIAKKQSEALLGDLVGLLTKHLKKGDRVRLSGLGILQVRKRAARMGRNPATGEAIKIKASKKVAFRAAKELKEAV